MFGEILRKPAAASPEPAAAMVSAFGRRAAFFDIRQEHLATVRAFFLNLRDRLPTPVGLLEKPARANRPKHRPGASAAAGTLIAQNPAVDAVLPIGAEVGVIEA